MISFGFIQFCLSLLIIISNQINALHRGAFQFRICSADGLATDPTMECFDQNKMFLAPGVDFKGKPIPAGLTEIATDRPYTRTANPLYNNEGNEEGQKRSDDITGIKGWQTYLVQLPEGLTCRHCVMQVI